MASPAFHFASQASLLEYSATAASPVVATLDDLSGVDSVTWAVTSTDDSDTVAARAATVVVSGTKNSVCTVTASGVGSGGLLQCTVNAGIDKQTDQPSAALTTSAKWFVPTTNGLQVGVANEQLQAHATFGWGKAINETTRKVDSLSPSGVAPTALATPNALALRDGAGGCAFVLASGTAFVTAAANPASVGLLRGATTTILLASRDAANTGDLSILSTDGSDNVAFGDGTQVASIQHNTKTGGFHSFAVNGAETARFVAGALKFPGNASSLGAIRLPNNSGIGVRNAGNTNDIIALDVDGSDNVFIGDGAAAAAVQIGAKTGGFVGFNINGVESARVDGTQLELTVGLLTWKATAGDVTVEQLTTGSATGSAMTVQAQNALTTGGKLVLTSGTGVTPGSLWLQYGGTTKITIDSNGITFNGSTRNTGSTAIYGTTTAFDCSGGNVQIVTFGAGNITTLNITNMKAYAVYHFVFIQDGVGSRTLAVPANMKPAGGAFVLSTGASKRDTWTGWSDGTNVYEISRAMNV